MTALLVYITTDGKEEADRIGAILVEKRLAACVNIVDGMESLFWWNGNVDRGRETILIAKTKEALLERLTDAVTKAHSYDCPCVVALPIIGGHPDFLKWIEDETV